jgi:hypothetical protein
VLLSSWWEVQDAAIYLILHGKFPDMLQDPWSLKTLVMYQALNIHRAYLLECMHLIILPNMIWPNIINRVDQWNVLQDVQKIWTTLWLRAGDWTLPWKFKLLFVSREC